jgi:hypothetical protein
MYEIPVEETPSGCMYVMVILGSGFKLNPTELDAKRDIKSCQCIMVYVKG